MKYWNINGYGYDASECSGALRKYGKDFHQKMKIGESNHLVITRITKKELDGYAK